MPFYIVTMTHPDGEGWGRHVAAHVSYLKELVAAGMLRASGPLKGTPSRAGFLIMSAPSRAAVEAAIAKDPFAVADLIVSLDIEEWDPLFGTFAAESSGDLPGAGPVSSLLQSAGALHKDGDLPAWRRQARCLSRAAI